MRDLPQGWSWVALQDLGTEVRDPVVPAAGQHYELWSVPAFATGHPEQTVGEQIGSTKLSVQENDVLICKINPRINRVWMVARQEARIQIASPEWLILRPASSAPPHLSRYLQNYLSSAEFRVWIRSKASGATGSHTRAKSQDILRRMIPLPPSDEQLRIVVTMESILDRLEHGLHAGQRAQTQARRLATTSLREVVEQGAAAAGPDQLRLSEIARVGSGGTPPKSKPEYYEGGDIPWVTSGDLGQGDIHEVNGRVTQIAIERTAVRVWPIGTLLMAMYGEGKTRGTIAELHISATTNQACAAIELLPEYRHLKSWVRIVLQSRYAAIRQLSAGGVQPNLNLGLIKSFTVPNPPEEVRTQLLKEQAETEESARRLIEAADRAIARDGKLRHALHRSAFAGELVDQDPADEPSAVLLARFRAERDAAARQSRNLRNRKAASQ